MANVKISDLLAAGAVSGTNLLETSEDAGAGTFASKKATLTQLAAWLASLAQTLVNKTLQAATFTAGYTEGAIAANTGAAYTIDLANGSLQILTLTANATFTFPAPTLGKSFTLFLLQDATGSRTVTWPGTVKWPGSTAPTVTAAAAKGDKYVFTGDGTNWWGSVAGQSYL